MGRLSFGYSGGGTTIEGRTKQPQRCDPDCRVCMVSYSYSWKPYSNTAWSQLSKRAQLLHRIDTNAEAGLIARGGIHVQRALLDCLVEREHRLAVGLFGGFFFGLF